MPRYIYTAETLNTETGELTKKERVFTTRAKAQPYTMLLLPVNPRLLRLTRAKDLQAFLLLAGAAEHDNGKVPLTKERRQVVMAALGVSSQHLSNILSRLRTAGLITGRHADLAIDSTVMWKGSTHGREQLLAQRREAVQSDFDTEQPTNE